MKRLLCLAVIACFLLLTASSNVFSLSHPYEWQGPSIENEGHPWGGEDNADDGDPIGSVSKQNDYHTYTGNWTLDLIINTIVNGDSRSYRPHRGFTEPANDENTESSTAKTTAKGN